MKEPNLEKFQNTINTAKSWGIYGEEYANEFYDHLDLIESQKVQTELWNKIVFPEFNAIYLQIRPKNNNEDISDKINRDSESAHLAGIIWNEKFEHYRYYNGCIYYLELKPGLSQPDLIFRKYSAERFCKEISRTSFDDRREFVKLRKKNDRLQKVLGFMLLLIPVSYILFLLVKK